MLNIQMSKHYVIKIFKHIFTLNDTDNINWIASDRKYDILHR